MVTRFTSLIAVDDSQRVSDGRPKTVVEALDEPEGVDVAMAGGEQRPSADEHSRYGYEYAGDELDDICQIDPAACPMLDTRKESVLSKQVAHHEVAESAPRRGCGCRVAGDPSGDPRTAAAGALALCLLLLRRARLSRARARLE